jgi:[acyl-carrier-protein] S-malonyltransferase
MRDASDRFAELLAAVEVRMPSIQVLHNVTVSPAQSAAQVRDLLARQLYRPVRWVETVQAMADRGIQVCIEAGPGKVLTGLGKRIDKRVETFAAFDQDGLGQAMEVCADA